jgi:PIN domain nuclease of toxin-antitoxin system
LKLLLDSHILIWWLADDARLGAQRRRAIARSTVRVSAMSIWELLLKRATGRLSFDPDILAESIAAQEFTELPLTEAHARCATELPPIHRDPVDRFLIAQAVVEELTLVTDDETIRRYAVPTL